MENQKIQEMQMLEQNLQNLLLQKQAFQMEFSEAESALQAIENSGEEVFKIIGQLMVKTEKSKIKEELENKKKMLELRTRTMETQENSLTEQLGKLREEVMKTMKK
ncbi:prefoldin subunit beta [Candidatus Pacearchaeota archaeon]|nr:prefoldin subunit beta [Candidatus Pacearchaeota archaeon]